MREESQESQESQQSQEIEITRKASETRITVNPTPEPITTTTSSATQMSPPAIIDTTTVKISMPEVKIEKMLEIMLENLNTKLIEQNFVLEEATVMKLFQYGMEVIEIYDISGSRKKELVLEMITSLIEDSNLEESKKETLRHIISSGIASNMIDIIVSASKGELNINALKEEVIEIAEEATTNCLMHCIRGVFTKVTSKTKKHPETF